MLQPGVRPEPLRWESLVQDTGPPETSQPNVISISKSSPRDLHFNAKTQLPAPPDYQQAPVLDTPCNTTSKTGTQLQPLAGSCLNHTKFTDTPKYTTKPDPAHQKDKIQPHSPEHRHLSPQPGALHNPLNQPHPLGADTKNNRNYEPTACEKETTNTVS